MEYLDYNATTPVDEEVAKLVMHYMVEEFGNAGSRTHEYGLNAKKAVNKARKQIAQIVDADPNEVIFTSGATESNNIVILGLKDFAVKSSKKHIITTSIEHKAVLEPLKYLENQGFEVTYLPVGKSGRVDPSDLESSLRDDTVLVSIMHVNNETGIIQPIEEIAEMLKNHSAYYHVDAAQGFAKHLPPLKNKRIDFISCSGHKIYAPKGIGALILRNRKYSPPPLAPILYGGGQERGLRPGTQAVPLIAGFGFAAEKLYKDNNNWLTKKVKKRELLLDQLKKYNFQLIGDQNYCMPNIFSIQLEDWDSEAFILVNKSNWAISNGSACTSDKITPSHVLEAMKLDAIKGGIRFSY